MTIMRKNVVVALVLAIIGTPSLSFASVDGLEVSADTKPLRFVSVDGDAQKFSAHHWVADHYTGGINDFSSQYTLPNDIEVSMDGHALVDENDLGGNFEIRKNDLGFIELDYSEFRKYYSGLGGVYYPFTSLPVNKIDKELAMNIGHLRVETGLTIEDWPRLTFEYEREWKEGAKSRLTWGSVKEGSVARKIAPSWQEVHEIGDVFAIKAEHDLKGFELSGDQRWEFNRAENMREEINLATTGVASDTKIRDQIQNPESQMVSTTLGAKRWFNEEKMFTSAAYRYVHITNQELEDILEMNSSRQLRNFTSPKQIRNARADNRFSSYTYVGNFMVAPVSWINVITKLKAESYNRLSSSEYPSDSTPVAAGGAAPDGNINTIEVSENDTKAHRWGEGLSLRFTAIPRTALYADGELEQSRLWMSEERDSRGFQSAPSAGEIFKRETVDFIRNGTWVLGMHTSPWRFVNLTTHFREHRDNNDYDDKHETDGSAAGARSAFMDVQNFKTDEFMTRVAFRPRLWFQPSFRYKFRGDNFATRVENQTVVDTAMNSHIYTVDFATQIIKNMTNTVSFSRQTSRTVTPAMSSNAIAIPPFRADVNTWILGTEYCFPRDIIFATSMEYSRANNFNEFTNIGLPLGVDNKSLDLDAGFKIPVGKSVSLNPTYHFYHFGTNDHAEAGGYNAHVASMDVTIAWA